MKRYLVKTRHGWYLVDTGGSATVSQAREQATRYSHEAAERRLKQHEGSTMEAEQDRRLQ